MGPMTAAARFLDDLRAGANPIPGAGEPAHVSCSLHGSLAFTGKGHATDRAVVLGLCGFEPATVDPDEAEAALARVAETGQVTPRWLARRCSSTRKRTSNSTTDRRCRAMPTRWC
jgi:L-serine dehydratase